MTMLERMTKELRHSGVSDPKGVALRLLAVMRVPSEFMVQTLDGADEVHCFGSPMCDLEISDTWPIMIDAIIREAESVS